VVASQKAAIASRKSASASTERSSFGDPGPDASSSEVPSIKRNHQMNELGRLALRLAQRMESS
jgi:hypothetical protein